MDTYTRQHLLNWVEHQFREEDQESVFDSMASFLFHADDVDYWTNQGWWRVYYAATDEGSA